MREDALELEPVQFVLLHDVEELRDEIRAAGVGGDERGEGGRAAPAADGDQGRDLHLHFNTVYGEMKVAPPIYLHFSRCSHQPPSPCSQNP